MAWRRVPDHAELVAVCDVDADRAQGAAERWEVDAEPDLDALLARDDLDVVDLCTPPSLHDEQVRSVLASGRHVVCEKPLVGSLAAIDGLAEAEAASGRRLMPIFQYRFGHGLQKVKHLVDTGIAGTTHTSTVDVAWRRRAEYYAAPWRGLLATELGGVLLSQAVHAIDMLTYVAGPVRRAFARTTTRVNDIEVEDCAAVSLELADGSLGTLSATLGSSDEVTRHRFCFTELSAESNPSAYENSGEPWTITPDTPEAEARITESLAAFDPGPEGYIGQFQRFAEALRNGGELPVTLADARASIELITALYVSAREGRDVTLPLPPDDPAYAGWVTE
ncbi:MAG: Gfo/Idh/MocA family oxidoreductase [Acidimicrobiia bacterium]|nr:Gfo/Idh/MocA family oxidoreductase [Acidimicrobiia bacterium]